MAPDEKSICFVIPHFVTFSTGGAEIQIHYLTQAFLQRGWKVEVVCAGAGKKQQIESSPFFNENIKYHYYRKRTIRTLEFFDVSRILKTPVLIITISEPILPLPHLPIFLLKKISEKWCTPWPAMRIRIKINIRIP